MKLPMLFQRRSLPQGEAETRTCYLGPQHSRGQLCEPDVTCQVPGCAPLVCDPCSSMLISSPCSACKRLSGAGSCSSASGRTFCPKAELLSLPIHPWGQPVTHSIFDSGPGTRSFHNYQNWPYGIGIKDISCDIRQV